MGVLHVDTFNTNTTFSKIADLTGGGGGGETTSFINYKNISEAEFEIKLMKKLTL